MDAKLNLEMQPQPCETTCGPTCLHALYRYYGDSISLEQTVREVPSLPGGGTLAVLLACHALKRGYSAKIFTYNLNLFDPTWFSSVSVDIRRQLTAQLKYKKAAKFQTATRAYIDFLDRGGKLKFEDLNPALIRKHLNRRHPILTGLSATYLYRCSREFGPKADYDSVRGYPSGHFVILSGYDRANKTVEISDPLLPNPLGHPHQYEVRMERVINAILLGIVTYDANLLIIQPDASA